jgi:hypothetical protein
MSPASLVVAPPVPVPAPPTAAPTQERPRPTGGGGGGIVSKRALASWIEAHPDWAPGGPLAAGSKYLSWLATDADSGAPASLFTPKLADSYCRDLGGHLPPPSAEPRVPAEGTFELRHAGNKYVLLDPIGEDQVREVPAESHGVVTSIAVFRCVK